MSDEEPLEPADRRFENALRSLRPVPARIDLAAIAACQRVHFRRVRLWRIAAAIALLAGGSWIVMGLREHNRQVLERFAAVSEPDNVLESENPVELPTLLTYRRALNVSPAEFDAVLERQALLGTTPENTATPVAILALWKADLHTSSGEM
jgi:hypothetical protein